MNGKSCLVGCFVVLGILFIGIRMTFSRQTPELNPITNLTVIKAWWPVWDTFEIGVKRRERIDSIFRTTFKQADDYGAAVRNFRQADVDAATLTIFEALQAAADGIDLKIVLILDYTIGSDGLVASRHIHSLKELRGKRVGIEKGTIAHFTALKALEQAGLDPEDVEFVDLDTDALQDAFINHTIDAAGTYEPYMSQITNEGGGHVLFSSKEIPRSICDVLFLKTAAVRQHPEMIRHWINAWDDVLQYKNTESQAYLSALSRLNGTSVSSLNKSLAGIFIADMMENKMAFGTSLQPGYLRDSLQEMQQFMLEQGVIQNPVDIPSLIYLDGVQRFHQK